MKTILTYGCKCGEDFYEDDTECINCGSLIDKRRLKKEPLIDIKKETLFRSTPYVNKTEGTLPE